MTNGQLAALTILPLLWACDSPSEPADPEIEFNLKPRLTADGNGYYHLTLTEDSWQTLHRISGHITEDGKPLENMKFGWESSHYWILGDTLGYIVRRGLSDQVRYVAIDTSYIIGFSGFEVPTVNCCSYSNAEGEVNTMFAPVQSMRHDTVTVTASFYGYSSELETHELRIVLE